MNEPKDPEAAEPAQTTNVPALAAVAPCSACRFWEEIDWLQEGGSPVGRCNSPTVYRGRVGYCEKEGRDETKTMLRNGVLQPEEGGCTGMFITGPDFGCIHFCSNTQSQTPPDPEAAADPVAICSECNGNGVWEQGVCLDCAGTGVNPVPPEQRQCVMCKQMGHYYYECNNGEFFRSMGDAFGINL